jgi:nucleotide-binding universal stress UspA family protein
MKILATFDGSKCSEAIVPHLEWLARLDGAEFTFLSIARQPRDAAHVRTASQPVVAESPGTGSTPLGIPGAAPAGGETIERTLADRGDYLADIVSRMPRGRSYSVEVTVADDAAAAIIRYAMEHSPDIIVMGTHGEAGMVHRVFGDVAEQVVRSGVAPVLLVPSNPARRPTK